MYWFGNIYIFRLWKRNSKMGKNYNKLVKVSIGKNKDGDGRYKKLFYLFMLFNF